MQFIPFISAAFVSLLALQSAPAPATTAKPAPDTKPAAAA